VILPISVCAWLRSNELRMVSTGVSARVRSSIKAVLFCYFYLWLMTAGSGAWSLDAWIDRQRGRHPFRHWKRWLTSFEPYTRSLMRAIVGFLVFRCSPDGWRTP